MISDFGVSVAYSLLVASLGEEEVGKKISPLSYLKLALRQPWV